MRIWRGGPRRTGFNIWWLRRLVGSAAGPVATRPVPAARVRGACAPGAIGSGPGGLTTSFLGRGVAVLQLHTRVAALPGGRSWRWRCWRCRRAWLPAATPPRLPRSSGAGAAVAAGAAAVAVAGAGARRRRRRRRRCLPAGACLPVPAGACRCLPWPCLLASLSG